MYTLFSNNLLLNIAKVLDRNTSTVLVKMTLKEYKKLVDMDIVSNEENEFECTKPVKAKDLLHIF